MREVDEALARAYAHREKADPSRGVPPAPHWPGHAALQAAAHEPVALRGRANGAAFAPGSDASPSGSLAELQWPAVVLRLEQEWGDRFDGLAEQLIDARRRQDLRTILFTSCHRAEGARPSSSRSPARWRDTRVARCSSTPTSRGRCCARLLGLRPEVGLDDVVEGGHALADALVDAPDDHLALLPIRCAVARPRDFLAAPAWSYTLARLRREFDLIILDGGPMFAGLNAAVLHRSVDAAVLVYHRGFTGERALLRAREVLEAGGVPLLGLAETFV